MFRRTKVIMPAAEANWEVWSCSSGQGSVWLGSADDPVQAANGAGAVVVALPARSCRTLSFSAPTRDRQLVRKLAWAQLEKRGLTAGTAEQTAFDCHVHEESDGRSLISVDVVMPETAAALTPTKARGLVPMARLFDLPAGKLVVMEEQGRLVLCAGAGGRLIHSQVVSATRDLNGHAAPEIRIASLALQQQGVLPEVTGVELWGDFSAGDAHELGEQLRLPVQAKSRPAPDSRAVRRAGSAHLLPAAAREALRKRRMHWLRWIGAAAALALIVWWWQVQRNNLEGLEAEAARMEAAVTASSGESGKLKAEQERVHAAQERWAALRMALEPRRYPLVHLNGLTRCLASGGVVLGRFESKVTDVSVSGTARSAMDAYAWFNAVSQDKELSVYGWSMAQPLLAADGTAAFELKGKMR